MAENGPTGREWGNLTRHVEEIRHDLRNHKTVLNMHDEKLRALESTVAAVVARVYTSVAVAAVFFGMIGFFLKLFFQ
jgi:hypothetical protein